MQKTLGKRLEMCYTITKKARGPVHRRKPGQGRHDYTPAGITEGGIVVISPSTIAWVRVAMVPPSFFAHAPENERSNPMKKQKNARAGA